MLHLSINAAPYARVFTTIIAIHISFYEPRSLMIPMNVAYASSVLVVLKTQFKFSFPDFYNNVDEAIEQEDQQNTKHWTATKKLEKKKMCLLTIPSVVMCIFVRIFIFLVYFTLIIASSCEVELFSLNIFAFPLCVAVWLVFFRVFSLLDAY